jgi:hypothetical protein
MMTGADSSSEGAASAPPPRGETAERIARWTPSARLLWLVVVLGGLLAYLPSLTAPLQLDDYLHASMANGSFPAPRGPTELYDFVSDRDRAVLLDRGVLPWWSHPGLTIRFFRPLSSVVLWASHRALGGHVVAMHAVSFVWWLLGVGAVHLLLRRTFAPRTTAIATLLFALAPCHALPLAWIANFEVLVSLTFGVLGLAAYARWRERGRARDALLATLAYALALLGGEYALCFGGYVLAYELVSRRDAPLRRALGLLPFAAPAAAYLWARARLGCGSFGSGFYADPLRDPVGFLRKAPFRFAALLDDAWLSFGSETWSRGTPRWIAWVLAVGGVAACALPIRRAIAALDPAPRTAAKWLLLGSLLAMAPVLAVKPSPRVLGASAIGVALVVAIVLDHAWFPRVVGPRRGASELTFVVATLLGFLHLVHAPLASFAQGLEARRTGAEFAAHLEQLRQTVPLASRDDVVVVRGLAEMFFAPFALDAGRGFPRRWRVLSQTGHVLMLRHDARSFDLVVGPEDCMTWSGPDDLFRGEDTPVRAGKVVALSGMRALVLEANARGATRVRFTFDAPLETAAKAWVHEGTSGFEQLPRLPSPGFAMPIEP